MTQMTLDQALAIRDGEGKLNVAQAAEAIQLLEQEGDVQSVEAIRAKLTGKKPAKTKAVASAKAPAKPKTPAKPKAPKAAPAPKAPAAPQAPEAVTEEKPKAKKRTAPKKAPAVQAPEASEQEPLIGLPEGYVELVTKDPMELAQHIMRKPYRVALFLEEENDKGEPIVTMFRVLFVDPQNIVLYDASFKKGMTVTEPHKSFDFPNLVFKQGKEKFQFRVALMPEKKK